MVERLDTAGGHVRLDARELPSKRRGRKQSEAPLERMQLGKRGFAIAMAARGSQFCKRHAGGLEQYVAKMYRCTSARAICSPGRADKRRADVARQVFEFFVEPVERQRFRDDLVDTGLDAAPVLCLERSRSQRVNRHVDRFRAQRTCKLGAAHTRHADIGEDGVERAPVEHLQHCSAAARRGDSASERMQLLLEQVAIDGIVVDDQYRQRPVDTGTRTGYGQFAVRVRNFAAGHNA